MRSLNDFISDREVPTDGYVNLGSSSCALLLIRRIDVRAPGAAPVTRLERGQEPFYGGLGIAVPRRDAATSIAGQAPSAARATSNDRHEHDQYESAFTHLCLLIPPRHS